MPTFIWSPPGDANLMVDGRYVTKGQRVDLTDEAAARVRKTNGAATLIDADDDAPPPKRRGRAPASDLPPEVVASEPKPRHARGTPEVTPNADGGANA